MAIDATIVNRERPSVGLRSRSWSCSCKLGTEASLFRKCQYTAPFVILAPRAMSSMEVLTNPFLAKRLIDAARIASRVAWLCCAFVVGVSVRSSEIPIVQYLNKSGYQYPVSSSGRCVDSLSSAPTPISRPGQLGLFWPTDGTLAQGERSSAFWKM